MSETTVSRQRRLSPHLRGHVFLFDPPPATALSTDAGIRLLLIAAFLEIVRLSAVRWLSPTVPLLVLVAGLLALALLSVPRFACLRWSQLGFRPWREWTTTEKSYFCQVVVLANIVFPIVLAAPLRVLIGHPQNLWEVFVPYLLFGFYQELVYRGMIQLELVRRWGALAGIVVSNLLYTFGPLHWNYFTAESSFAVPMFVAIFAIGLLFGVVYRRSGNLWLVAVFHAIGNAYIVLSSGPIR